VIYKGSCHCGKVAFEVEGELAGAMACNCSICSRKGSCNDNTIGDRPWRHRWQARLHWSPERPEERAEE